MVVIYGYITMHGHMNIKWFAVFERSIRTVPVRCISVPINNVNPFDHVMEILRDVGDHSLTMNSLSSFSYAVALFRVVYRI